MREKKALAAALAKYAPPDAEKDTDDGVLPPWYPRLLDLLTRHLRRPNVMTDELRYAEWAAEATLAKEQANVVDAFGQAADPFAAKLLATCAGSLSPWPALIPTSEPSPAISLRRAKPRTGGNSPRCPLIEALVY